MPSKNFIAIWIIYGGDASKQEIHDEQWIREASEI